MGSQQSAQSTQSGYVSIEDSITIERWERDIVNMKSDIIQLEKEGKPTEEHKRILRLYEMHVDKLKSK